MTLIGPDVAASGTVAQSDVSLSSQKVVGVPLNSTDVAPVNPLPNTFTWLMAPPLVGENPVPDGAALLTTVKVCVDHPPPYCVDTPIGPLTAPAGTKAVICVSLLTLKFAC